MVDQFVFDAPEDFVRREPTMGEWCRSVTLLLDDLTRVDGAISTSQTTTATVLTQQEKLDLMSITQAVDLDDMESKINAIATASPNYSISNDGTVRTLNADDAAGAISASPSQAEMENLRDAILALADFVATMNRDLQSKGVFS